MGGLQRQLAEAIKAGKKVLRENDLPWALQVGLSDGPRMASDGSGWPRMASEGLRRASDCFRWLPVASDGFGWLRMDSWIEWLPMAPDGF